MACCSVAESRPTADPVEHTRLPYSVFRSLLKFMSIELVMLSNHLTLCHPLLPGAFPMSQLFPSGGQSWGFSFNISLDMKVKVTQSCPTLCNPLDYSPWNSPGQITGVGSLSLLLGIFPTQVSHIAGRFFTS